MFLRVVSVPSDVMTQTNKIYVSPQDHVKATHLLLRGFPYTLETDPAVSAGTIAMNSIQRKCCGITTTAGDTVDVMGSAFDPEAALAAQMKIEVEYIAASKKGGSLDCKEFTEWFLAQFRDMYFTPGQYFAAIYDSQAKYIVRVLDLEAVAANGEPRPIGSVAATTKIIITAKEKCEISLTNISDTQIDSQQQSIVNPFDLEKLGIGGLRAEFGQVFRRAFASRIFPKSLIKKLGINHVKGVLLYGPPGTGKTLIARKIGDILNCKPPKIVAGPEVFNKFVGGTEENVRKLFAEAEADQLSKGEQSPLHLIIFDEFDAICKHRGAVRDSTGVSDNVVNQLLSKIDGVNCLNNVLLIGMTNRKDLIDEAILRPGRFEVHVEIGLPDEKGRVEVFRIHTRGMRENEVMDPSVSLEELAEKTKNFSGAEIEGVVKAATSHAFNRHIDFEHPSETLDASNVKITMEDFMKALKDVVPAFGQSKDECDGLMRSGIIDYGTMWKHIHRQCENYVQHLKHGAKLQSLPVLLEGPVGSGKSAAAAHLAMVSGFPYVKVISSDTLVGYSEAQKSNIIRKAFEDAYKSQHSVIILDDLERLVEFSNLGARYSNILLQSILVLVKRPPPEGKKLLIIGTTSQLDVMEQLELTNAFSVTLHIPTVEPNALAPVVAGLGTHFKTQGDLESCKEAMPPNLPMKKLILLVEVATDVDTSKGTTERSISYESFAAALVSIGLSSVS